MDKRIKESLSAMMDDESNELEVRRVLGQSDDLELRSAWQRYHVAKHVQQHISPDLAKIDVSAAVAQAIGNEQLLGSQSEPNESKLTLVGGQQSPSAGAPAVRRRAGYWSVGAAACVMMALALFFERGVNTVEPIGEPLLAQSPTPDAELSQAAQGKMPKIVSEMTPGQAQRFNEYLLRHAEHATFSAAGRSAPLARVASYNAVGI